MKKIVLFLVVLITGTLQAQIKVGVNSGKPIVEFPKSTGDFKRIGFYEYANDKFGKVIDPKNIVQESVFTATNCAEEKTVDLGTEKGGKLKYKLDCKKDKNKVTFYVNTINDADKIVLYFVKQPDPENPRFVKEGISIISSNAGVVVFYGGDEYKQIHLYEDGTFNEIAVTIKPDMFDSDTKKETQLGSTEADKVAYTISKADKKICFKDNSGTPSTCFDLKGDKFSLGKADTPKETVTNTEDDETELGETLTDFPLLKLEPITDKKYHKKNRILVIDTDPKTVLNGNNTGLKKIKQFEKKSDDKTSAIRELESTYTLPNKGYLSVAINSYRFHKLENFEIIVNGDNYSYESDIQTLQNLVPKSKKAGTDDAADAAALEKDSLVTEDPKSPLLVNYLKNIIIVLKSYDYISLNDLYEVTEYKTELDAYYKKHLEEFDAFALPLKNKIMAWHPENVLLTPIPIDVPAKDEVEIKYTLKNKGTGSVNKSLGTFRTMGKFSVDYGAALFYTNLVNNNIYKDTRIITPATDTQPAVTETKAKMDDNKQGSFGLGINLDMSYKTGSELRPTLNFGFFVPLEEDITPYATGGLGVGIFGKDYKVNFSYGLAVGKVNSIKDRYNDVDITGMELEESNLIEKRVKFGYYFALAVSFNLGR
ncbi:hypothetical protein [Flavobacterium cerinum]|uniref:Outer membrane protein beta-barrel domain-containing protein n=1 Tax=Flavobacterium cerinum TaxID=2502784 RepID=A0ABY5IPF5_9FLAO|nr:hypothetical protein [Flavobacterium cerinum]UUC44715.1 hypothetical protein NOX80_13875 [Flavobacterium cerinum]